MLFFGALEKCASRNKCDAQSCAEIIGYLKNIARRPPHMKPYANNSLSILLYTIDSIESLTKPGLPA